MKIIDYKFRADYFFVAYAFGCPFWKNYGGSCSFIPFHIKRIRRNIQLSNHAETSHHFPETGHKKRESALYGQTPWMTQPWNIGDVVSFPGILGMENCTSDYSVITWYVFDGKEYCLNYHRMDEGKFLHAKNPEEGNKIPYIVNSMYLSRTMGFLKCVTIL